MELSKNTYTYILALLLVGLLSSPFWLPYVSFAVAAPPDFSLFLFSDEGFWVSDIYSPENYFVESTPATWLEVSTVDYVGSVSKSSIAKIVDPGGWGEKYVEPGEEFFVTIDILSKSDGKIHVVIPVRASIQQSAGYITDNTACEWHSGSYTYKDIVLYRDYDDDVDLEAVTSGYLGETETNGCPCWYYYKSYWSDGDLKAIYQGFYHYIGSSSPACGVKLTMGYVGEADESKCVTYDSWFRPWILDCESGVVLRDCCGYRSVVNTGSPFAVCNNNQLFFKKDITSSAVTLNGWGTVTEALLVDKEGRFAVKVNTRGKVYIKFSEEFIAEEMALSTTTTIPTTTSTTTTTTTTLPVTTTTKATTTTTTFSTTSTTGYVSTTTSIPITTTTQPQEEKTSPNTMLLICLGGGIMFAVLLKNHIS